MQLDHAVCAALAGSCLAALAASGAAPAFAAGAAEEPRPADLGGAIYSPFTPAERPDGPVGEATARPLPHANPAPARDDANAGLRTPAEARAQVRAEAPQDAGPGLAATVVTALVAAGLLAALVGLLIEA